MTSKTTTNAKKSDADDSAGDPARAARARRDRPRSKALKAKSSRMGGLGVGTIALFVAVGLVALAIIGYAGWKVWDKTRPFGEQRAQKISGVVNYRAKDVDWLTNRHVAGPQKYQTSPPVGGNHNSAWENCEGDVYTEQIPKEHAVHSLEHGAVWITYRPDLPSDEVNALKKKVQGVGYMMMSPFPGLDSPISLQAWGFMLKVDSADDSRIDKFIKAFRQHSNVERGATCSGGITITGEKPYDPQPGQPGQQMPGQQPAQGQPAAGQPPAQGQAPAQGAPAGQKGA